MPENNHFKISEIISRHLGGDISPWEKEFLDSWLSESAHHRELFAKWTNQHTLTEKKNAYERIKIEPAWEKFNAIRQKVVRRKRQIRRLRLSRYAAILLFPLTVSWFIWQENRTIYPPVSNPPIQAGQPQARLTLSNGRQFILDNQNRQIEDGDNTIPADSGKINYTLAKIPSRNREIYHTLDIPRGGEYSITLEDGTKVWLNAESRLKFPVEFCRETREVYLTGEAFFKVTSDTSHPFIVITDQARITVLGTSFNVSSYPDDQTMHTTLEEGKVQVKAIRSGESMQMQAGEQIRLEKNGKMSKEKTDVTHYTSWKSGRFVFKDMPLDKLLRQLARWYDVEIHFQKEKRKQITFTGDLKKYENLNEILEIIELTSEARFMTEGRKITVY